MSNRRTRKKRNVSEELIRRYELQRLFKEKMGDYWESLVIEYKEPTLEELCEIHKNIKAFSEQRFFIDEKSE